jgi:hypothetical protein
MAGAAVAGIAGTAVIKTVVARARHGARVAITAAILVAEEPEAVELPREKGGVNSGDLLVFVSGKVVRGERAVRARVIVVA